MTDEKKKKSPWSLLSSKLKGSPNSSPGMFSSTSKDPLKSVDEAFDEYILGDTKEEEEEATTSFNSYSLSSLLKKDKEIGEVPSIFELLFTYLLKNGLNEKEIFTKETNHINMEKVSKVIAGLENYKIKLEKFQLPVIGFVFKKFLKDLKYPVIPFDLHEQYMTLYSSEKEYYSDSNIEMLIFKIRKVNESLPSVNAAVLKRTIELLHVMVQNGTRNDTSSIQLSKIFGKLIFHPKNNIHKCFQHVMIMIRFYNDIFQNGIESKYDFKFSGPLGSEEILFVFDDSYDEIVSDSKSKSKKAGISLGSKEKISKKAVMKGTVKHKNNFTHKWHSVYLYLRVDKALVYNSKEEFKDGKKQIYSFALDGAVIEDIEDYKGHQFCFSVFAHNVDYKFEAPTNESREDWKKCFIEVMNGKFA
jgi:hypothetical protein